jgi:hypothetical protein
MYTAHSSRSLATLTISLLPVLGCRDKAVDGAIDVPAGDTRPGWFVVSEVIPLHGDSYLMYLTRPEDVLTARDLINGRIEPLIIVAEIEEGSDGINRNTLHPDAPFYSWHVSRVVGFTDATIEILDGTPEGVENDVPGWIDSTGGMIGFWSYTITARYSARP